MLKYKWQHNPRQIQGKCKIQGNIAGTVTDIHKGNTCFVRLHELCWCTQLHLRQPDAWEKDEIGGFVVTGIDEERNVAD